MKEAPVHHAAKPQEPQRVVVIKKDHKREQPKATVSAPKEVDRHPYDKIAEKAIKPVHVDPMPKKAHQIVPMIEEPKKLSSKDVMDIADDDDEMDQNIKS